MNNYETAIIKTIAYANVFQYPLVPFEIWRFLIWQDKRRPRFSHFSQTLSLLTQQKKIAKIKNFYLFKQNYVWTGQREKMNLYAKDKINIGKRVAYLLSFLPTIDFIGLTGKLALGIAQKEDDIDFFIITKFNSLWITRLTILAFLSFLGIKRNPQDLQTKNKICVNMLVDRNHLSIPKNEQDLFCSHEIAQMKPLFIRNDCYADFLNKNKWVGRYLPNVIGKVTQVPKVSKVPQVSREGENLFEQIACKAQLWYMRNRRTREVIREGYARFHPQDARKWILSKYHENIKYHGYHE